MKTYTNICQESNSLNFIEHPQVTLTTRFKMRAAEAILYVLELGSFSSNGAMFRK